MTRHRDSGDWGPQRLNKATLFWWYLPLVLVGIGTAAICFAVR